MFEIYDNWERLVEAVLRKEELWALSHSKSPCPSISSDSSSDFSSTTVSFRLEIEQLESLDFGSRPRIEELIPDDEGVRSSESKDDHQTRDIVPVPRRENHITRIPKFPVVKMKVLINLAIFDDKSRIKVIKNISRLLAGLESASFDMKAKKLIVIGADMDPVALDMILRNDFHTEIMYVGPIRELDKESDEEDELEKESEEEDKLEKEFEEDDDEKKDGPNLAKMIKIEAFDSTSSPEFIELYDIIELLYPGGGKSNSVTAGPVRIQ